MIPLKIRLRNFMCYGDEVPALSLESIHVACLCGDNGSGKSAILDSITWALWGKSRADGDDELVREGATEMEVDFEFTAQGKSYRVLRKHSKGTSTRSGSTLLNLQAVADGICQDISGNTKTETQQRIIDLLRLDYKTFTNSAYIMQGRANEFTVADPAERKRVLAAILDLSQYDELSDLAKTRSADRASEAKRLEGAITAIDSELAVRGQHEAESKLLEESLSATQTEKAQVERSLSTLQERVQDLTAKKNKLESITALLPQLNADLNRWNLRSADLSRQVSEAEKVEAAREDIERGYAKIQNLKRENDLLNEQAQRLLALSSGVSRLEMTIERAQNFLMTEHRDVQRKLEEQRRKTENIAALELALEQAHAELQAVAKSEQSLAEKQHKATALATQAEHLKSQNARLSAEATQIEGKLTLLTAKGARCPVCDTELGEQGIDLVRKNYREDLAAKMQAGRDAAQQIESLLRERNVLDADIARTEPELKKRRALAQGNAAKLESELSQSREASRQSILDTEKLEAVELRLAKRDFAVSEQRALQELREQVASISYDSNRHEELKAQIKGAPAIESRWTALQEALRRLPEMKSELAQVAETVSVLKQRLNDQSLNAQELSRETSQLSSLVSQAAGVRASCENLAEVEKKLREKAAVVQERLRRCAQLQSDRTVRQREFSVAVEEDSLYRQLCDAFGKRGIQALLIEQAVPQIRDEADRLLKRLTDNRMSIAINTQKPTKKGSIVETLDIVVSDESGYTRNYEMFSGGEAFRIDFALRVALSRLLTRRSGASLSTLFIDEGFGTQDASGRERLVEVINSVQDEFEKIIVITHLEELKDAFPARIEVSRTPSGSAITLN